MDTLLYFTKVNLYWVLFYGIYWFMLRQHTFFKLNRLYLLGALVISLVLPAIQVNPTVTAIPEVVSATTQNVATLLVDSTPQTDSVNWGFMLKVIYVGSVVYMLLRLLKGIYHIAFLIKKGEFIPCDNYTLILLPNNRDQKTSVGSFSFFKWLVISHQDYEHCFETILHHESVHIKQWHSIDILFIEILKAFFWFNPVLWLYKFSIQEVHEYLADKQAPNRESYAAFLVSYAQGAFVESIANPFYHSSFLKNRIHMLYKKRTSIWQLPKYLVIIPLVALVVLRTSGKEQLSKLKDLSASISPEKEPQKEPLIQNNINPSAVKKPAQKKRKRIKRELVLQNTETPQDTLKETYAPSSASMSSFRKTYLHLRPTLDTILDQPKQDAKTYSNYRYPATLPTSPVRSMPPANSTSKN
ncbi:M56 family metallopeptidase [Runella zeae]|uniref:M56 family metallopeptidase n=1 Tax=Runella zeae TaxID=94255 RepID=UPI000402D119|nr:M56 family metallopeptidase [Runella zeae]